jgi:enoyl-CoA hydratase
MGGKYESNNDLSGNNSRATSAHARLADLEFLQYAESDHVATVTINRPSVHNAISLATMTELERVLDSVNERSDINALILTGAGERVFVSGGDLKDFERLDTHEAAVAMSRRMQHLTARLEGLPIPVIGAINGDCLGGGCEVALAADIRIVAENAHFGFKQVTLGITPAWGGRRRLVHLVGRSKAMLLLLSGDLIDAVEAKRIGLADDIVGKGKALETALGVARRIAANPPLAVRTIKQMVNSDDRGDEEGITFEAELFARTWMSHDHQEALAARKEKRAAVFRGN